MSTPAIIVENLSKQYVLGGEVDQSKTFREMLSGTFKQPMQRLKRLQGNSKSQDKFWALKDINFKINEGEVVGIIGANGAGKSTLLKVLSRITAPTTGAVHYKGRMASLLEVGTGFHPELSGRENIYVNGAILGMTKADIRKRFDEIVEFAGVEQFLDTPVKRYSSGMYVRLAFGVSAHMDPDIMVVDEVLAVGDVKFQKKCMGKMKDVADEGRTVIFVSHNMGMISKLCSRGIVLDNGKVLMDGSVSDAVQGYMKNSMSDSAIPDQEFFGELKSDVTFHEVSINGYKKRTGCVISPKDTINICVKGLTKKEFQGYRTTIEIIKDGERLMSIHDSISTYLLKKGEYIVEVNLPKYFLSPGEYSLKVGGYLSSGPWVWAVNIAYFSVANEWFKEFDTNSNMGMINLHDAGSHRFIS